MADLFERSAPTQWGPIDPEAGPYHRVFVESMRALYDRRKAREAAFCYETVATAVFTSESTISRILNGKVLPAIESTFDIVMAISGKPPTKSLVEQWRKTASERRPNKDKGEFEAQIRKAYERLDQDDLSGPDGTSGGAAVPVRPSPRGRRAGPRPRIEMIEPVSCRMTSAPSPAAPMPGKGHCRTDRVGLLDRVKDQLALSDPGSHGTLAVRGPQPPAGRGRAGTDGTR